MVRLSAIAMVAAGLLAGGLALAQTDTRPGAPPNNPGHPASDPGHPTTPPGQPTQSDTDTGTATAADNPPPPKTNYDTGLHYKIDKLDTGLGGYGTGGYGTGKGLGGIDYPPINLHFEDTGTGCKVAPACGLMQPVQGVFQDDPAPKVTYDYMHGAKDNPVIDEISPGVFTANLPMVAARKTVVMGIRKYRSNGAVTPGFSWRTIVFKGIGDCHTEADVKFRLKLTDINGNWTIWTSPVVGKAPIHGSPGGQMEPFEVYVSATDGLPPKEVGAFVIPGPGPYTLTAELIDAKSGEPTGLQVVVGGQVVSTDPPTVEFVPVTLSGAPSAADGAAFKTFVDQVTTEANAFLPDYFPTSPYGVPTFDRNALDLTDLDPHEESENWNRWDWEAAAANRLGGAGVLSGATRVVAIVRNGAQGSSDFTRIGSPKSVAMTSSTKVIFVGAKRGGDPDHPFVPAAPATPADSWPDSGIIEDIAHELNHSEPDLLWSGDTDARHNETRDCGFNDHNTTLRTGYGERLTVGSEETQRVPQDQSISIMGSASSGNQWITQCAYAHLIYSFGHGVDPKVLFVRTILSNRNKVMSAKLAPSYDQLGEVDDAEGPAPDWAIVVRQGSVSKSYPIDPHWFSEEDYTRDTLSLMAHIPDPEGAATLQVVYRGKVLASRELAAQPPSLEVTAPPAVGKGATVHLSWNANAANGGRALSSVFYSTNKGRWYVDRLFESTATEADVVLDAQAKDHVIKVVVTDGGRSSERLIRYSTP